MPMPVRLSVSVAFSLPVFCHVSHLGAWQRISSFPRQWSVTRSLHSRSSAQNAMLAEASTLYVVATPIGHPRDVTLRARDILSSVDIIAAEDTRITSALLSALSIDRPLSQKILSCHAHNYRARIPFLLSQLVGGGSVALVTDAGTPCIQDPGFEIVEAVVAAGIRVSPLPGPSAALAALAASALPCPTFTFIGFLPRTSTQRKISLEQIISNPHPVVLYEAPHRLRTTLHDLAEQESTGKRAVCIGRELTKKWEQFLRFENLARACDHFNNVEPRGEFTLIIAAISQEPICRDGTLEDYKGDVNMDVAHLIKSLVRNGMPVSQIAKIIAASSSIPKKLIYTYAVAVKNSLSSGIQSPKETT